jgi:hypothetical protein
MSGGSTLGENQAVAGKNIPPAAGPVWISVGNTIDIGMIDKAAASVVRCLPAPIRLPEGVGGAKGHGLLHIQDNKRRMNEIGGLELGYKNATQFVVDIARNWTKIALANEPNRLVLVRSVPAMISN